MTITNINNLPQTLVDMVKSDYTYTDKRYSVTTIIRPLREIILSRRHNDEIEKDASTCAATIFGRTMHQFAENARQLDTELVEHKIAEIADNGYTLSGIIDNYNESKKLVIDWKTCSVSKFTKQEFDDWKAQGYGYAWLLSQHDYPVEKVMFVAIMKDWSEKRTSQVNYPTAPIMTVEFDITPEIIENMGKWINNRLVEIENAEKLADNDLPMCTEAERWNDGTKYNVMKNENKTSVNKKPFGTIEEANALIAQELENPKNAKNTYRVEEVPGEDTKCNRYCDCCKFCPYWIAKHTAEEV